MATAPDIFTKSCTYNGTEPCLRMQTRGQLLRLTGLQPNWKTARVGMIASITAAAGDNLTPVAETIGIGTNTHFNLLFGLSDGVAFPGDAGGHFVGARGYGSDPVTILNSSGWRISRNSGTDLAWDALWTNGAAQSVSYGLIGQELAMADPTDVVSYCFGMVLEIDVSVAGTLSCKSGGIANLGRADSAQMSAILNGSVGSAAITYGGWWSSSVPVGCQYFLMRPPFSLNSMRVHNYDAIQLA